MSGFPSGLPSGLLPYAPGGWTTTATNTTATATWTTALGSSAPYAQLNQNALYQLQIQQAQMQQHPAQGYTLRQYPGPPVQGYGGVAAPSSPVPNRYLAGSDLLEDFIRYCAPHGVTKREFRKLPLELFIQWLVLQAARHDEEDVSDLPDPAMQLAITYQPQMSAADLGL